MVLVVRLLGMLVLVMHCPTLLRVVVQLQEEKDPHHWGVDTGAIHHAISECGIDFIRTEVRPWPDTTAVYIVYMQ